MAPNSDIQFSLKRPSRESYKKFIEGLRDRLKGAMKWGILVIRHGGLDKNRFVLVDLSGMGDHPPTITVAIDVETLYVVGYRVDNTSYLLQQNPEQHVPINLLFPGTTRGVMGGTKPPRRHGEPLLPPPPLVVTGDYGPLQRAFFVDYPHLNKEKEKSGKEAREFITLGIVPLHEAITNLRNNEHVAEALLVIIQMVSEAARFNYIKDQVSESIEYRRNFPVDPRMISLENEWSSLSKRIHGARADGSFQETAVEIKDADYATIKVNSVKMALDHGTIAMISYAKVQVGDPAPPPPSRAGGSRKSTGASGSRKS